MFYSKENCLPEFVEILKPIEQLKEPIIKSAFQTVQQHDEFFHSSEYGLNMLRNKEAIGSILGLGVDSNFAANLTKNTGLNFYKAGGYLPDLLCENNNIPVELKCISSNGIYVMDKDTGRIGLNTGNITTFSSYLNCAENTGVNKSNEGSFYIVINALPPYDIFNNYIENGTHRIFRIYIGYFYPKNFKAHSNKSSVPKELLQEQGYDIYEDYTILNEIKNQVNKYNEQHPTKREKSRESKEYEYAKVLIEHIKSNIKNQNPLTHFAAKHRTEYGYFREHNLLKETCEFAKKELGEDYTKFKINNIPIFC